MTEAEKSQKDSQRASTNLVAMGVLHFFFAFFASLGYAIHLEYWKPFWIATLTAIASVFVSVIIGGILGAIIGLYGGSSEAATIVGFIVGVPLGFIAPLVSFLMFRARILALRDRVKDV